MRSNVANDNSHDDTADDPWRETADTPSFLRIAPRPRTGSQPGPVVRRDRTGLALYAISTYAVGDVVFSFKNVAWKINRDQFTVEHTSGAHLCHPLLARIAHSCSPNGRFELRQRVLIATRPIKPGDCITVDYAITERVISHPFDCLCGAETCRGRIG